MSVVRRAILVRHGRTAYNAQHRIQGSSDIPLDASGLWQVRQTARALRGLYVCQPGKTRTAVELGARKPASKQLVVASDLVRAQQTAHAFADPLGLDIHIDPRVRERAFGQWEARSIEELEAQYPQDFASWMDHSGAELQYGAEAKPAVGERGAQAVNDWARRGDADTDLYVFAHGSLIAQTIQALLEMRDIPHAFEHSVVMRNGFWAVLIPSEQPDGTVNWRLEEFNHGPRISEEMDWDDPRKT